MVFFIKYSVYCCSAIRSCRTLCFSLCLLVLLVCAERKQSSPWLCNACRELNKDGTVSSHKSLICPEYVSSGDHMVREKLKERGKKITKPEKNLISSYKDCAGITTWIEIEWCIAFVMLFIPVFWVVLCYVVCWRVSFLITCEK